jgi:exosortase A-associated hydrolase 2
VSTVDTFYLPMGQGDRFCLLHRPENPRAPSGAVLYVHPFAEEMNKSRRMAALQARAFADAGLAVLQIDLLGCGDSSGDFADATWQCWVEDVVAAAAWLRTQLDHEPILWGLRAGCLLVADALRATQRTTDLVLWQPVISGKQFLQQFLRFKLASQVTDESGGQRTGMQKLRDQLAVGESIEVAGYTLSPRLALEMEAAQLDVPGNRARVAWLEIAGAPDGELAPASRTALEAWRKQGHSVQSSAVAGSRFWQTVEISESPALVDATLAMWRSWSA